MNGDGYGDVIIGAFGYDHGQIDEGGAFVYMGSPSGLAAAPAWTAEGNQLESAFGAPVASAGDVNRDGYGDVEPARRTRELVIAAVSTNYTLFLMWAAGYVFLFLACILLAPATVLYILARRQQGARVFTRPGLAIFIVVLAFAVIGVVLLATGVVQI